MLPKIPIEAFAASWTPAQLNAFSVATEELSHFHYLVYQTGQGRNISQLELEIQGEIDRFLLCLFTHQNPEKKIDSIIDSLFEKYRLSANLNDEQKERYQRANSIARNFIVKHLRKLADPQNRDTLFRFLRRYYRLCGAEKLAIAGGS